MMGVTRSGWFQISLCLGAVITPVVLPGCAGGEAKWTLGTPGMTSVPTDAVHWDNPRRLPMFAGATGATVTWEDLLNAIADARVVIVGELHDDVMGRAVELALTQDLFVAQRTGAGNVAISLEFLERDEQVFVDDYLDGLLDADAFMERTGLITAERKQEWNESFQPLVDAAKEAGANVVASNAPRRYVRLARTDGYERLAAIPGVRRGFFDLPATPLRTPYRQRFMDLMRNAGPHGESDATATMTREQADAQHEAGFRSQQLWDATMSASIVNALRSGTRTVLHVIGQFHSDFNGGTVLETRKRMRTAGVAGRILVISMQQRDTVTLDQEDHGRADVIIHTGARPPESELEPESEEPTTTTQPATTPAEAPPATAPQ